MSEFDRYDDSFRAAIHFLRKSGFALKAAKITGTVLGAGLVAASPWLGQKFGSVAPNLESISLWVGLVLTVVGSLVLVFADQIATDTLEENLRLSRDNLVLEDNLQFFNDFSSHLLSRVSLNTYVREVIETAVTEGCKDEEQLQKFSYAILGLLAERRHSLFEMGDEYWNFSVYRPDASSGRLICLACRRESPDDEKSEHRSWTPGEGHVGLAFLRGQEIIFSDATSDELKPVLSAKGEQLKQYDEQRYKSLASMPISTDGKQPLGILIATSDRVGRFKNESERSEDDWEREDVLREVAAYLAILFKLIHDAGKSGEDENAQDEG